MYERLKNKILRWVRLSDEPADPAGSPGTLLVFRASPKVYRLKMFIWGAVHAISFCVLVVVEGFIGLRSLAEDAAAGPLNDNWGPLMSWAVQLDERLLIALLVISLLLFFAEALYSAVMIRLTYDMRCYKVTDSSLRIREGIWHVREMTMTFANIQNVSVTRNPLQRLMGIGSVRVQTAGGGSAGQAEAAATFDMHTAYFHGIDDPDGVRDIMIQRLRRYRDGGLSDTGESATTQLDSDALVEVAQDLLQEARAFRRLAEREQRL